MGRVTLSQPGFGSRGVFDYFQQSMRTAVPIFLQKRRLQFEKAEADKQLLLEKEAIEHEFLTDQLKMKAEEDKAKTKIATDLYTNALGDGNQELAQSIGPQLEQLAGINLPKEELEGPPLPGREGDLTQYLVPEQDTEKFNQDATLWKLAGGDFNKYVEMKQKLKAKGMSLSVDKDGNVTFQQGGPQGSGLAPQNLGKKLINTIQGKAFNAVEALVPISKMIQEFDPSFLEYGTRFESGVWNKLKTKAGGALGNVSDEDREKMVQYQNYRKTSLEMINDYIKKITGAQMSAQEADRLRAAQPDFGENWWNGDDPESFISALRAQHRKIKLSLIRYNMLLSPEYGLTPQAIKNIAEKNPDQLIMSLEKVDGIVKEKGDAYRAEIKRTNPNISTQDLLTQIKERLSMELGTKF